MKQAETQKGAADGTVTARLPETYQWLLVPGQSSPQAPVEWQAIRLTGTDALAVRASKKLRNEELLVTAFAPSRLRMELDKVPLWRGDHVAIRQLAKDFARYHYLPRFRDASVLLHAIDEGLALMTWERDSYAYADSYDAEAGRYRGLRDGQRVALGGTDSAGLLVKPVVARRQMDAESTQVTTGVTGPGARVTGGGNAAGGTGETPPGPTKPVPTQPKRFYGTVTLDPARVGRDASRIADEVIAHLSGLVGAKVTVTLEIEAHIPNGAADNVVRTVTENSRTLKFSSLGFEGE